MGLSHDTIHEINTHKKCPVQTDSVVRLGLIGAYTAIAALC